MFLCRFKISLRGKKRKSKSIIVKKSFVCCRLTNQIYVQHIHSVSFDSISLLLPFEYVFTNAFLWKCFLFNLNLIRNYWNSSARVRYRYLIRFMCNILPINYSDVREMKVSNVCEQVPLITQELMIFILLHLKVFIGESCFKYQASTRLSRIQRFSLQRFTNWFRFIKKTFLLPATTVGIYKINKTSSINFIHEIACEREKNSANKSHLISFLYFQTWSQLNLLLKSWHGMEQSRVSLAEAPDSA